MAGKDQEVQIPEALQSEYDALQAEAQELESTREKFSYKKDKKFHRLIDVETQRKAIKQDPSLYDGKNNRYTQKGKRQLAAAQKVDDAQKAGYRILPTKDGKFSVVDQDGIIVDPDKSIVQGTTDADKGMLSFMNKKSISNKAASRFIGHAMDNNLFVSDPEYLKSQEIYDRNKVIDDQITAINTRWGDILKGYSLTTPVEGKKTVKPTETTKPKGSVQPNMIPPGAGVRPYNPNLMEPGQGVLKYNPPANKDPFDLHRDWRNMIGESSTQKQSKPEEVLDAGSFADNFDLNLEDAASFATASALFSTYGAFTQGKSSNVAFAAGMILNTIDATLDENRSGVWEGLSGFAALVSSMAGFKGKARKAGLKKIAESVPKATRAKFITNTAEKIKQFADSKVFHIGVGTNLIIQFGVELRDLEQKVKAGGKITTDEVAHVLTRLAQIGAVTRVAARTSKLGSAAASVGRKAASPVNLNTYRVKTRTPRKPRTSKTVQSGVKPPVTPAKPPVTPAKPKVTPAKAAKAVKKSKTSVKAVVEKTKAAATKSTQKSKSKTTATKSKESAKNKSTDTKKSKLKLSKGGSIYAVPAINVENLIQSYSHGGRLVRKAQSSAEVILPEGDNPYSGVWDYGQPEDYMRATPNPWKTDHTSTLNSKVIDPYASVPAEDKAYKNSLETSEWFKTRNTSKDRSFDNGRIVYSLNVPKNWEAVLSGSEIQGIGSQKVYVVNDAPGKVFTNKNELDAYLQQFNQKYSDGNKGNREQDSDSLRTPFLTATGIARGAVPFKSIADVVLNEIAYRSRETSPFIKSEAAPYTALPVFAAKSQPWEVIRAKEDEVLAREYDARGMTSDPIANSINNRRMHSIGLNAMNKIRSEAAQWNQRQVERQEQGEVAAVRNRADWEYKENQRINQDLLRKQRYLDQNVMQNNQARNTYLGNWGAITSGLQDHWNNISSNIQYPNEAKLANQLQVLQQSYYNEQAGTNNPAVLEDLMRQMNEVSTNLSKYNRRKQGGAKIFWGGDKDVTGGDPDNLDMTQSDTFD